MGQTEILTGLKQMDSIEKGKWYSLREVIDYLKDNKLLKSREKDVSDDLYRLCLFNLVDIRITGLVKLHKEYRVK